LFVKEKWSKSKLFKFEGSKLNLQQILEMLDTIYIFADYL